MHGNANRVSTRVVLMVGTLLALTLGGVLLVPPIAARPAALARERVQPTDNATAAGTLRDGVHTLRLEARVDSAAIAQLEQDIENAIARRDTVFLSGVFASTFHWTHYGSEDRRETRPQFLSGLQRQPSAATGRTISRAVDSLVVEVHDDIALTTGRIHVVREGGTNRRLQNFTIRYVRLYRRRDSADSWQLVTHRATALTEGPPGNR